MISKELVSKKSDIKANVRIFIGLKTILIRYFGHFRHNLLFLE